MNSSGVVPSIHDAFNARALQPEQVAQTFVPSAHYAQLIRQVHTLIVGPRGSGKTTLLKMLQQPALEAWSHPEAELYRKGVAFTGVFIPTDVGWRDQMQSLGSGRLEVPHARLFLMSAFTTHVLRAILVAIRYRADPAPSPTGIAYGRVSLSPENEETLVRHLAGEWHLPVSIPSLLGLKHALNARLSLIYELSSRESHLAPDGRAARLDKFAFLHLDFLQAASLAIDMFDDLAGAGSTRWALLFDELELAPPWIVERLIKSLRSVNDRFLFKLSMSPFNNDLAQADNALSPMEGHDYDTIPLWYAHKEDGYEFCRALIRSMLQARGIANFEAEALLGRSEFETLPGEWVSHGTAYRPGSRLQRRFSQMAERDRSFAQYLERKNTNPNLENVPEGDERAAEIRKITSLVAVREAFRGKDTPEKGRPMRRLRTRKNPQLYTGAKSLFAVSEGNPRWVKGILARLLTDLSATHTIAPARQAKEVLEAAHRFRALLKTIPSPSVISGEPARGLLSILDRVGDYLFQTIVVDDFNPDPPGTFIVDSRTRPELMDSLGRALNAGAIVYIPEGPASAVLSTLRGKRFRVSYLLAPYYQIPLILGKPIALSSILAKRDESTLFAGMETPDE